MVDGPRYRAHVITADDNGLLQPLRSWPGHTIFNDGNVRLLSDGGTLRLDVLTPDRQAQHIAFGPSGNLAEARRRYTASMARKLGHPEAERIVSLAFGALNHV